MGERGRPPVCGGVSRHEGFSRDRWPCLPCALSVVRDRTAVIAHSPSDLDHLDQLLHRRGRLLERGVLVRRQLDLDDLLERRARRA